MAQAQTYSLVLPVHNQADHIAAIADGYLGVADRLGLDCELILVTNACSDRSPEICAELAAAHANVLTLDLAARGWGRAVKAGLAEARGDILCYTNSARTSAEILALVLAYAAAYPGVVLKANRRIRASWRRRFGSVLYNLECRALFDLATWDVNGTPKLFPRTFSRLMQLERDDDLIDLEFVTVCRRENYPIIEVPVLATTRHGGRSTTGYGSAVRMYWGAYAMSRLRR